MSSGSERMILIDAHSLIFQVFHAIPEMTNSSGLLTNALYGFTRDLLYLRGDMKPDYLLCAFDMPGPVFRERIDAQYKANRAPMPDQLSSQIPLIRQMLDAMRVPVLAKEEFEADDLIATVARGSEGRGIDVLICTTDKDCRQLIDDHVRLFNLRKREYLDRAALLKDWGVAPEQVVDLQTLVGDSVDNVQGAKGIGIKTAAKLLNQYGTLDNLFAHLDEIPGKKRENLENFREHVERSRSLVRLDTHVDVPLDWEGWRLRDWDAPRLLDLFKEWGFRSFADEIRKRSEASSPKPRGNYLWAEMNDDEDRQPTRKATETVKTVVEPARDAWSARYQLVNTPRLWEAFFNQLREQKRFAIDLETTGLEPRRADIVGYAFSWQAGEGYYLPVRGPAGETLLDPADTLAALKDLLENPRITKINQNIKYDLLVLRQQGVRLAGVVGDSMIADYLLHAGERSHNLDDLSLRYLNHRPIPITDLIGKPGKGQLCMDQVPIARTAEYAAEDADIAWRLCEHLEPQLREQGLDRLYADLEIPLIDVLAEMEFNGVHLDVPLLRRLSADMALQLEQLEQDIYDLAGRKFNVASPAQLREVLFTEMKLPSLRKTGVKGKASTDQETLERLAALGHPLPKRILEHRQIAKLKGTYVDALPLLVNPETGRVHASFNQTVAATGRLSSSDPNLQNIPVRTEMGRQIRQAFIPEEGMQLLTADYSQIELRLLAHFSDDDNLKQAFVEDRDIHSAVAARMFLVPEDEVDSDMRRAAKTVNFGIIYGMSAKGLAQRLGVPNEEAARFIDSYFAQYPGVLHYQDRLLSACLRDHAVGTILGRRRKITGIRANTTHQQRNQPEREAINMEIQGSAADLIKKAMLNIHRRLQRETVRASMLLQIHDELVFEVHPDDVPAVADLVTHEMTSALELKVPLKVDLGVGENWLDVRELETAVR